VRNFTNLPVFLRAAVQARARESRHTGRGPGLGAPDRDLIRGNKGKQGGKSAEATLGALFICAASADDLDRLR
jgi:hypothetical protein